MPITTGGGKAGKGKSELEGLDNVESISNVSITTRAFQVWQSCLEKVSWAPWVVALEQLLGMLPLFVIPWFSYEMKSWDHSSAPAP